VSGTSYNPADYTLQFCPKGSMSYCGQLHTYWSHNALCGGQFLTDPELLGWEIV